MNRAIFPLMFLRRSLPFKNIYRIKYKNLIMNKIKYFCLFTFIFTILVFSFSVVAQNDLDKKLMMGYQGWFLCEGDDSPPNDWRHWFTSTTYPSVSKLGIDFWPDMSE